MMQTNNRRRIVEALQSDCQRRLSTDQAEQLSRFTEKVVATFSEEDLGNWKTSDLFGFCHQQWQLIQDFDAAKPRVNVFNPDFERDGWQTSHTVITLHCANTPFILDSVRNQLNNRNLTIYTVFNMPLSVSRNETGRLLDVQTSKEPFVHAVAENANENSEEVFLFFEICRRADEQELDDIAALISDVLQDVASAVGDFHTMSETLQSLIELVAATPGVSEEAREERCDFIAWLLNRHFTFLGYEKLVINDANGKAEVFCEQEASLGLSRIKPSDGIAALQEELNSGNATQLLDNQVAFFKATERSRVHRLVYPDYVAIRIFDERGVLRNEHRFLGLYTANAYAADPVTIPIIRRKVDFVLANSGYAENSHEASELLRVLQVYPRDELFQSHSEFLLKTSVAIHQIQERRQTRVFLRMDLRNGFASCLVYMPREVYRTELRQKVQDLLCDELGAVEAEFTTLFSESVLTRTHFVLRLNNRQDKAFDSKQLEEGIAKVTMSWQDHLHNHLLEDFGEEQGTVFYRLYEKSFPPGYQDDFEPRTAIVDIKKIDLLNSDDDIEMGFYRSIGDDENTLRFRLYRMQQPLPLSDVMPILEKLGMRVVGERPYMLRRSDSTTVWVQEFSLIYSLAKSIDIDLVSELFKEGFDRVWNGDAESDGFNKLIIGAKMAWREVALLRAYSRYLKQLQFNFSGDYIAETLSRHLNITSQLVKLFNVRFNPELNASDEQRNRVEDDLRQRILAALDDVDNLSEDRIFRQYIAVIDATLRTNFYQPDADGKPKNYFSFKLKPSLIPEVPLPVPMYEIFVYSPRVEGVHLRGGKVARGGLRWSDRLEDFRTEVLGLVKAQQVKNAVIVPVGAKGGFVAKNAHLLESREEFQEEGISCYRIFISSLLDITDNIKDEQVVPPANVVRKDDDDPYLVVAADKGTATFSDIANEISLNYGHWLGDAFASGGSIGYDHKKMGITAKGAWVSVQRLFREKGINIQETDFTVVGVGDMGGDVFGNGMLLSEHIQLTAAFNHLHIFVDPNPDSAKSFVERKRLFDMPRSSWEDYNTELMSEGGGIFKRSAKYIDISPQMKERFSISEDRLTPTQLISALLKAPVDLLWNGGIGTYVKASSETDADAGDKANDGLRVNGKDLRCRVIGEGGNLGCTQLGRIEFALNGGAVNTDFIDNAAGVDCSDHEVNIKILLNRIVESGDLTEKQRRELLESMTDSVSELVLANNYRQTQAISLAERQADRRLGEYRRLINVMEASGRLNRSLEFIPDDETLVERKANGKSLTRPELSVLISYVKSQLKDELSKPVIAENKYLTSYLNSAFPEKLVNTYPELVEGHSLRQQIIATQVANGMVNHMGITFVERMQQSTGASSVDVALAYITAQSIFDLDEYWTQIEDLDYKISSSIQMELMADINRLVRRSSRWFIRNRRSTLNPAKDVEFFKPQISKLGEQLPEMLRGQLAEEREKRYAHFTASGVPDKLASFTASVSGLYQLLGIVEASKEFGGDVAHVAETFFELGHQLELDWFAQRIGDLKIDSHWQALARESYRDDLEWQQRSLTMGAMRYHCTDVSISECIAQWTEQQSLLVERWRAMLAELHNSDGNDFAMFAVAIRELLDLAQSSRYDEG